MYEMPQMSKAVSRTKAVSTIAEVSPSAEVIPEELALEIRRLAHDLSNALEVVVQTSYLLGLSELKAPASEWLRTMDSGVNRALVVNQELREFIKRNSQK